ncbi:hypothetical protein DBB36_08540 [Flavobacterium sp. WLB]|uniref:hypothetical protein n=1 Tax=unclassified Flavobacterium TaxID=196869 RepID=UPI0006AB7B31|nr:MULTISPECIES: hypothetical protein [unclassified Flavobacterium]KOP36638.1 hypothetical protein AKO67_19690 [Flavobacterium sp. VMW]OWU91940.1 hypothetical protein APR43_04800 [Flavobacterium sp. NLM]PUU70404.1 hypothetical protein DBB36_08540 [Flavobacterium sp. WLB]
MLKKDRKLFIFCLSIIFFSCTREKNNTVEYRLSSVKTVSIAENNKVYKQINDTVSNWIRNDIKYYAPFELSKTLIIDSLLCFNKDGTKLISAKLTRHDDKNSNSDGLDYFYGVKINKSWYFFNGAYIVLPRELYQKDIHTPLSFEKLHEIAMKEIFSGYLKKKDKGFWGNLVGKTEWEINDRFFRELNELRLPFETRKTDPNTYYSCRELNDKKEYEDCFFRHEALSVWNEDSISVNKDTYLYSPEFPVTKKLRQLKKGDLLRVIERIDNSDWCCVRMWDGNPNVGFIEKETIVKLKKSSR